MYFLVVLIAIGAALNGQVPTLQEQAASELGAAKDAQLVGRSVPLEELTEEQAAQLQQAARRQLDRAMTRLAQARVLVEAGLVPRQSLIAPTEELNLAQADYDVIVARTELVRQLAEIVRSEEVADVPAERQEGTTVLAVMERFDGRVPITPESVHRIKTAFEQQFHETLPVSAEGETALHRAMGFDHRNRVDVALVPDTPEGVWLRQYLERNAIPYYAFRGSVPGKATGAHIHIGPASNRIPLPGRG